MPVIKVIRNTYMDDQALKNVLDYVLCGPFTGGYSIDPDYAYELMAMVKNAYHKTGGVQLKHFIISFSSVEFDLLDFEGLSALGYQVGQFFREYQMVYAIHTETHHVHLHFVMNTVSFLDGHKFNGGLMPFYELRRILAEQFPRTGAELYLSERYTPSNPYIADVD